MARSSIGRKIAFHVIKMSSILIRVTNKLAIIFREVAQLGRALGLGPRGRRFESCLPDQKWGLSSAGRAPALHAGGQRFDPVRLHQNKTMEK